MPLSPVQVFSMGWLGFFEILLIVIGLVLLAAKLKGRGFALLLFGGGLLMMLMMVVALWSYQRVELPAERHDLVVDAYQDNGKFIRMARSDSFDEIKAHFDRNLIPLDKESPEETSKKGASEEPPQTPDKEKQSQEERPDWVDLPPTRIGNVYQVVVSTTNHPDMDACYQAVEQDLNEAVKVRIKQLTGEHHVPRLSRLGITTNFILSDICNQRWIETSDLSVGEWKRLHILMKFDAAVDDRIRNAYHAYFRKDLIMGIGIVAMGVVGILTLIYGLLQFDTFTRGYYTKRLFFGVPAAIIAVVTLIAIMS